MNRKPIILQTTESGRLYFVQTSDVEIVAPAAPSAYAAVGSAVSVPNGTWVTVLSSTITLTAERYVMAWADLSWHGGSSSVIGARISINGMNSPVRTQKSAGNDHGMAFSLSFRSGLLAAGTYTVTAAANVQAGPAINVDEGTLLALQA